LANKKEDKKAAKKPEKKEEKPKEQEKSEQKPVEQAKPEETKPKEKKEEPKGEKPEEKKPEEKPKKEAKPKQKPEEQEKPEKEPQEKKKTTEKKGDFKYIVRLSNTDVDGEKKLIYGLTSIKGIGLHLATLIADETAIDRTVKIGKLTDKQVEKLQNAINNVQNLAPAWMLNHRRDMETGKDIHLSGSEIDMRLRDEINIMKKIRSYKGIRHERGLRVRGQRTRGNNRTGLTLGVSKKSVQQKQSK